MTHWMEGDWPSEDPAFADVRKLVEVAKRVANGETTDNDLSELSDAVEAVELHGETEDAKINGWVGTNGQP